LDLTGQPYVGLGSQEVADDRLLTALAAIRRAAVHLAWLKPKPAFDEGGTEMTDSAPPEVASPSALVARPVVSRWAYHASWRARQGRGI